MVRYIVIRRITKRECPWLPFPIPEGRVLYQAEDTYGVVTAGGIPVSASPFGPGVPYFQVPRSALIVHP